MTVKELIEELKKCPDDAKIEVRTYDEKFNDLGVKYDGFDVSIFIRYIDKYGHYIR